jgi:hypothetical protein
MGGTGESVMGKFRVGDVVRSNSGWEAIVSGYKGENVLLYNEDAMFGKSKDYPYDPKGFTLVSTPASAVEQFGQSPTLLDQFAIAALTGLLSDSNVKPDSEGTEADFMSDVSECAYRHAQAMMKAREVQK